MDIQEAWCWDCDDGSEDGLVVLKIDDIFWAFYENVGDPLIRNDGLGWVGENPPAIRNSDSHKTSIEEALSYIHRWWEGSFPKELCNY
jgi:hypothetical protein